MIRKRLLAADLDYLRTMVESIVGATLEAEMTEALGAGQGERTAERLGYRSGYYAALHRSHWRVDAAVT